MQIKIEETKKEIKDHGAYGFPVNISVEHIEAYEQGIFMWHWHPEIELTLILSGKIEYRVNEKLYILEKGDGLFGNGNTLHSGAQIDGENCEYLTITFHPRFIYGYKGGILQSKYVDPILEHAGWDSLKLTEKEEWQRAVLESMRAIDQIYREKEDGYEFQIHILLSQIWFHLYSCFSHAPKEKMHQGKNMQRLQEMLTYIQNHYQEDISLGEIAAHVNISRNECCRFFRRYMNMTIVEYLTMVRIQNSLAFLEQGANVTQTANLVGFSSPAYFTQMFRRHMNMTPKEYQKNR